MKSITLALLVVALAGCSTFSSKAPMFCSLASPQDVAVAASAVMDELPNGPDKAKAAQYLALAQFSTELGCEAVRAIGAKKAAQDGRFLF